MTFTILYSLLVAIVGLLIYFIASNPKLVEVGRLTFQAGMIGFCIQLGGKVISAGTT